MSIIGISEINFYGAEKPLKTNVGNNVFKEPIFNFTEDDNATSQIINISQAKWDTEMFTNKIIRKLSSTTTESQRKKNEYYLRKLINNAQILNGVYENNLKPQGNNKQNEKFYTRIKELQNSMIDYAEFIDSGLSIIQDSKTGLYKLTINDKIYEIPKRKVEIQHEDIEGGYELMPTIVD